MPVLEKHKSAIAQKEEKRDIWEQPSWPQQYPSVCLNGPEALGQWVWQPMSAPAICWCCTPYPRLMRNPSWEVPYTAISLLFVMGWVVYPKKTCCSPNPENVKMWPRLSLCMYSRVKMRLFGWALIQYGWYPYKKWEFGHRQAYTKRECHVEIKEEIGMMFLKDKGCWRLLATTRI